MAELNSSTQNNGTTVTPVGTSEAVTLPLNTITGVSTRELLYYTGPYPTTPLNLLLAIETICQEVGSQLKSGWNIPQEKDSLIANYTEFFYRNSLQWRSND